MKIVVSVVVFNRFLNVKRWVDCWKQCNTQEAELVVIHNYYGNEPEKEKYQTYCEQNKIKYIPRNAQGFDIGALQDVFKNRLHGFPDYDYLLWCADDTFPMSKDFITPFIGKLQEPGVGVSCMQLSASVSPHVRTTGFCIKREIAEQIKFPVDPITTKQHCYLFEHRGRDTFTNQIRQMGLSCQAIAQNKTSPLWDAGYWKRLDRMAEHESVFGWEQGGNKIVFVCPIYDAYPQIISSLICQSENNWELMLIDDNENGDTKKIVDSYNDPRIKYIKKDRVGNYGHPLRKWALDELREVSCDLVCVSNPDNYYTPNFIKEVRQAFKKSHTAVAVYPDKMVHSYKNWDIIPCKLERGYLDCGGVVIKKDVACEVGWSNEKDHSADWTFFSDIASRYSWINFIPMKGCFFVHN